MHCVSSTDCEHFIGFKVCIAHLMPNRFKSYFTIFTSSKGIGNWVGGEWKQPSLKFILLLFSKCFDQNPMEFCYPNSGSLTNFFFLAPFPPYSRLWTENLPRTLMSIIWSSFDSWHALSAAALAALETQQGGVLIPTSKVLSWETLPLNHSKQNKVLSNGKQLDVHCTTTFMRLVVAEGIFFSEGTT